MNNHGIPTDRVEDFCLWIAQDDLGDGQIVAGQCRVVCRISRLRACNGIKQFIIDKSSAKWLASWGIAGDNVQLVPTPHTGYLLTDIPCGV